MADEENDMPFCDAFTFLATRGIFFMNGDLSTPMRKKTSIILPNKQLRWSIILAPSALVSGNNMKLLKSVIVLVKQPLPQGVLLYIPSNTRDKARG
jgi:hypothetical protein